MYPRQSNFRSAEPRGAWFDVYQFDGVVTRRFIVETEGLYAIVMCQKALNAMLAECGPGLRGQTLTTTPNPTSADVRLRNNRQIVIHAPERIEYNGQIDASFVAATLFENCIGGRIGVDERPLVESLFSHDTYSPLFTGLYYWLWKDRELRASMQRLSGQPVTQPALNGTRPHLDLATVLPEWGRAPAAPLRRMGPQVRYVGIQQEPGPRVGDLP